MPGAARTVSNRLARPCPTSGRTWPAPVFQGSTSVEQFADASFAVHHRKTLHIRDALGRLGTVLQAANPALGLAVCIAAAEDRELKIVAIADGAKDNWTLLESLAPDIRLIDVWHACRYLKAAADAAYGAESDRSAAWFDTCKAILTDDPQSVGKVIDVLRYLQQKGPGAGEITTAIGYFCSNRQRMRYKEARDAGTPSTAALSRRRTK